MARRPRPIWQTFLYVNRSKSGRRIAVMLFETQRAMREYNKRWRHEHRRRVRTTAIGPDTHGMASWYGRQTPGFKPRVQGIVWLHLGASGSGVVSHELTHIAVYVKGPRPGEQLRDWDERVAWLQGWLVTQYWRAWYRNGPDGGAD